MSIVSMKIKNLKSIKEAEIIFKNNLSGIYGPNGTGKTAVIEALEIIRNYFISYYKKEISEKVKEKVLQCVRKGENNLSIEVIFYISGILYKLAVEFNKSKEGNSLYVSREELSSVPLESKTLYAKPKKVYRSIARIENDEKTILPKIYLYEKEFDEMIEKEILLKNDLSKKELFLEYNNFCSYLSLVLKYSRYEKTEIVSEKLKDFIETFQKIEDTLMKVVVITLKEQALYNLDILIPLNVHTENIHGVLMVNYKKGGNIYSEKEASELEKVVNQIGNIFSIIVPHSKLKIHKKIENIGKDENKIGINIFVEKDGKEIPLEMESTGIVKLVSILSVMVYFVQDSEAIVAIDELDIHIFEYLLAVLLEKLSLYAKGQLIFTAHNLLPMEKLSKNSIIVSTKDENESVIYTYMENTSATTNLRQKYIKSQVMWSEKNISPLLLNNSAMDLYIKKLVI